MTISSPSVSPSSTIYSAPALGPRISSLAVNEKPSELASLTHTIDLLPVQSTDETGIVRLLYTLSVYGQY